MFVKYSKVQAFHPIEEHSKPLENSRMKHGTIIKSSYNSEISNKIIYFGFRAPRKKIGNFLLYIRQIF